MRRAVVAIAGTIAGLVALLGYKSSPVKRTVLSAPPGTGAPTTSSTGTPATDAAPASEATNAPTTTVPLPAGSKTVTGPDVPNQYGDVQVEIKLQGGRIVDVIPVQMPFDRQRSAEISQAAAPLLKQEVLDAQSAQIDIISGATYTTESYAESVQGALDKSRQ